MEDMMALVRMLSYRKKKSLGRELWKWVRYHEGERFNIASRPLTLREWGRKGSHKQ